MGVLHVFATNLESSCFDARFNLQFLLQKKTRNKNRSVGVEHPFSCFLLLKNLFLEQWARGVFGDSIFLIVIALKLL